MHCSQETGACSAHGRRKEGMFRMGSAFGPQNPVSRTGSLEPLLPPFIYSQLTGLTFISLHNLFRLSLTVDTLKWSVHGSSILSSRTLLSPSLKIKSGCSCSRGSESKACQPSSWECFHHLFGLLSFGILRRVRWRIACARLLASSN